ncbi:uncharacterized protein LOC129585029 [Paramacrobiotus metropolitanus]|uniref:uncharacterized protein LOC129585029 n=1 Tax=Paramacrobiotus metropolitanus TaxID=2943436 RepID=UPI002445D7E5|nr:uncharacterized protein LOC129585029 [Paramacrobiotus metropolitanus]
MITSTFGTYGAAEGNAHSEFQRTALGSIRPNSNGMSGLGTNRNGPAFAHTAAPSPVISSTSSLQNVVRRVFEPQFRNLQDLEQTVDKQQAGSLRLLRISQRERHRIITAPVDYFYRNILLPKLGRAIIWQFLYTFFLLTVWIFIAKFIDVFYIHLHLRTQNMFFHDFKHLFSVESVFSWRTVFGTLFLSVAASWHFARCLRVPPPVFIRREAKVTEMIHNVLLLNGPWILACLALLALRPNVPLAVEKTVDGNASLTREMELIEAADRSTAVLWWEIFLWEILFKILVPFIFVYSLIVAVDIYRFWKGEFFIGLLRDGIAGTPLWRKFFNSPISFIMEAKGAAVILIKDKLNIVVAVPNQPFLIVLGLLFFFPLLFPLGMLFRIWIYYHCLSFAIIRLWQFNLDVVKQSLVTAHKFTQLNFFDIVALPPVLKDLRRMNWVWLPYLELQLRSGIHECFRTETALLREFFTVKLSTRDLTQLGSFVQFWISPLRDYAIQLRKIKNVTSLPHFEMTHFKNVIWGVISYLMKMASFYDLRLMDSLDERYDGAGKALLATPSLHCLDDVRILSELYVRGDAMDEKSILTQYYDAAIEALAGLGVALKTTETNIDGTTLNELLQDSAELEPAIRFYLKSLKQLQVLVPLYLRELLKLVDVKSYDLRISDSDCSYYVQQLRRENLV